MRKNTNENLVFSHQRLDVYRVAFEYAKWVRTASAKLPANTASLRDQLTRATESVVLNIAEGAQQQTQAMRKRHYRIALGSAAESAAALELLGAYGADGLGDGEKLVRRVGQMLRVLAR